MPTALPEPLGSLVEQLGRLPGLGPKSALRIAMKMLEWPDSETRRLGETIASLRDSLGLCSKCGGISGRDPCAICADPSRDQDIICVVPEWDSILALENGGFYHGQYLVLGGLLSPQQKIDSQGLEVGHLLARLAEGEISEVILALGATLDGENTASYIKQLLERNYPDIIVTRLAQGIPLGGEVKYMDRETLRQSMQHRQKI